MLYSPLNKELDESFVSVVNIDDEELLEEVYEFISKYFSVSINESTWKNCDLFQKFKNEIYSDEQIVKDKIIIIRKAIWAFVNVKKALKDG